VIGVLFATAGEAAPFLELLSEVAPLSAIDDGVTECRLVNDTVVTALCGMGAEAATTVTKNLITRYSLKSALNLGIAGGLTPDVTVGGIYRVEQATFWPEGSAVRLTAPAPGFEDIAAARLVTSNAPVFDDALRARLARLGQIVDMEGAAIMRICEANRVPCAVIKCISDTAGKGDRNRLRANLETMSRKLAHCAAGRIIEGQNTESRR
jgi:nucleoside phosphorylase